MASEKALELSNNLANWSSAAGYWFVKQAANKVVDTAINSMLVSFCFYFIFV
jgi:hypothetical protein